jgi:ribosomal peptide maturation radical SAM protein 1
MAYYRPNPRLALIYPPYAPLHLPSLGLALFSAMMKKLGFHCRSFYWNLRFVQALPGDTQQERQTLYRYLGLPTFSPWNEWLFAKSVTPETLADKDSEVLRRLASLDIQFGTTLQRMLPSQIILSLCANVGNILRSMSDDLETYDIVGIGTTFSQNGPALALAKHVKERWPEKITVLGGANCDGEMGKTLLASYPFLDHVFSGEVDYSFPAFIQRIHEGAGVDDIPGIVYRDDNGEAQSGPPCPPLHDMNGLPTPDFDDYLSDRKRYGFFKASELCLPLESSRGCWWGAKSHCTFCGLNGTGMAYRQKDFERFKFEVETVVDRYGIRYLFMADNILSYKYYRDFIQWARQRNIGVDFFYEIKANTTRQQVRELAEAGVKIVQPGIESFSTKTLTLMGKGIRGIQNMAFLKYAREYGINCTWNLLAGFPGEESAEYEWMAGQVPKLVHLQPPYYVGNIEFHRFSPYHNDPKKFGLSLRPHEKYFFIYPFAEDTVARLAYVFEPKATAPGAPVVLRKVQDAVKRWRQTFDEATCSLTWETEGSDILITDRRPGFAPCDYRLQNHAVVAFQTLDQPRGTAALTTVNDESLHGPKRALRVLGNAEESPQVFAEPQEQKGSKPRERNGRRTESYQGSHAARSTWLLAPWAVPYVPERTIAFGKEEFSIRPQDCLKPLVDAGIVVEEDGWYLALPVRQSWSRMSALPEVLRSALAPATDANAP